MTDKQRELAEYFGFSEWEVWEDGTVREQQAELDEAAIVQRYNALLADALAFRALVEIASMDAVEHTELAATADWHESKWVAGFEPYDKPDVELAFGQTPHEAILSALRAVKEAGGE